MTIFTTLACASPGSARRALVLIASGQLAAGVAAADDFATLFDDDFAGIALTLSSPSEVRAARPSAVDVESAPLSDFALSAEDLALVLTLADPVGAREIVEQTVGRKPTIRERFLAWATKRPIKRETSGVFSGLVRDPDEPGVHVGIDIEEVRVEYRVGF